MTCPNCGHRVRDGAKYCDECGVVLPETTASASSSEPAQPGAEPRRLVAGNRAQRPASSNPRLEDATTTTPPEDLSRVRRIFALVAIGLIALLCVCCALAVASFVYLTQTPTGMVFPGIF